MNCETCGNSGIVWHPVPGRRVGKPMLCPEGCEHTEGVCQTCWDMGFVTANNAHGFREMKLCPKKCQAARKSHLWKECESCNDTGIVRRDVPFGHPDFNKAFPCPANCKTVQDRTKELWRFSNLKGDDLKIRLDTLETKGRRGTQEMINRAREVLAGELPVLTLLGRPGTGKTSVLKAVVNEFNAQGTRALFLDWTDLLARIKRGFDPKSEENSEDLFQEVLNCRVVGLDELDKARPTEWVQEILFRFINHRWMGGITPNPDERLITLFAMNGAPSDDYILSRLGDTRFGLVENQDADYRMYGNLFLRNAK